MYWSLSGVRHFLEHRNKQTDRLTQKTSIISAIVHVVACDVPLQLYSTCFLSLTFNTLNTLTYFYGSKCIVGGASVMAFISPHVSQLGMSGLLGGLHDPMILTSNSTVLFVAEISAEQRNSPLTFAVHCMHVLPSEYFSIKCSTVRYCNSGTYREICLGSIKILREV